MLFVFVFCSAIYARSEMSFDGMTADQFTTDQVAITAEVAKNLGINAEYITLTLQYSGRRQLNGTKKLKTIIAIIIAIIVLSLTM